MIDFRYHIVSLISVFLALAVGIILGAGPLQGAIGDQLTGQVEQLRTERNELRDARAHRPGADDADGGGLGQDEAEHGGAAGCHADGSAQTLGDRCDGVGG